MSTEEDVRLELVRSIKYRLISQPVEPGMAVAMVNSLIYLQNSTWFNYIAQTFASTLQMNAVWRRVDGMDYLFFEV